ncbi:MAG: carboxypeptidase regulatory-like domain-containing protein [Planctomycetes bacterium]|nr:carboxypeptidase regulatory-like domain-containing protein [Planctomycetota bacterium]
MSARTAFTLLSGLLLLLAAAIWLGSGEATPTDRPAGATPEAPPAAEPAVQPAPPTGAQEPEPQDQRELAGQGAAPTTASAQGLRGTVVDWLHRPLPGVEVFLLESVRNDPLAIPAMLQRGVGTGPVAATKSAADGSFAIGLPVPTDRLFELRCLSNAHADVQLGDLRILPDTWHDVGELILEPGTTIRGRVTIRGSTTPVPGATVTLSTGTVFEDVASQGLPGRERGLTAPVDASGNYELRHVPRHGRCQLAAVAPGFARVLRADLDLRGDAPVVVDFALPPGLLLRGTVVDAEGRAIQDARLEAWPIGPSAPPITARSRRDGSFDLVGLWAIGYRLKVLARGYQDLELAEVPAGRDDLRCELRPRATLAVRVVTPTGEPVLRYELGVRRWFPHDSDPLQGQVGLVAELPEQRVRLAPLDAVATVQGVPPGRFVLEIEAPGFAKTLSAPFDIQPTTPDLALEVVLDRGTTVRGQVLDELGAPLPGAIVQAEPDGAAPDNPVWRMLAQAVPDRRTKAKATADAAGWFALPSLARGIYQLRIDHPEACQEVLTGLRLDAEPEYSLPPIRLPIGAEVSGRATLGGKVASQLQVLATSRVEGPAAAVRPQRLETVTDATGAFRLPRRLPPGSYELQAAAVHQANPEAQVFEMLRQLQRSATIFTIAPLQRSAAVDIDIPTDR